MIVYGTAECIEKDPERFDIFKKRLAAVYWGNLDDDGLLAILDRDRCSLLRITPTRIFAND